MNQVMTRFGLSPMMELYKSNRALVLTIVTSSIVGIATIWLNLPMSGIVLATLVPWLPIIIAKTREDVARYGWLAIFQVLVILQLAHFGEHVSQIIELHFLDWAPSRARGIIGELDIEPVHFWWNLLILFGATLLLIRYKHNRWLWASFFFSIWHQVEHTYLYFWWYQPKGISGHPGILGAGGLLDQTNIYIPFLTTLGRADLHFWYNLFEIGLFVIAFADQVLAWQRAMPERLSPGWFKRAAIVIAVVQVALIALVALLQRTPPTRQVPGDFPSLQAAIDAAPEWAILRIAPGTFNETLYIAKPLTLIGASDGQTRLASRDDATPVIAVNQTHDVALKQLSIDGGLYGVLVEESTAVQILYNRISNAQFAGIRLSRAAADIVGNQIQNTNGPVGMGIELANTMSKPQSTINQNTIVANTHEGINLHNSHALIENNIVNGNGLRGIAITEMSMATVRSNLLSDNADAGIFVIDYSVASVTGNVIRGMKPGSTGNADGIHAYFYAQVILGYNTIDCEPDRAVTWGYEAVILHQ